MKFVKTADALLYRAVRFIACVAVFGMIALTFIDVLGRHFVQAVPGASEIISIMLSITFFSAMSIVVRERGHIVVGLFTRTYRAWVQRIEYRLSDLVSSLAMILIAWLMYTQGNKLIEAHTLTHFLSLKLGYISYIMAALAVPAAIYGMLRVFDPDPLAHPHQQEHGHARSDMDPQANKQEESE